MQNIFYPLLHLINFQSAKEFAFSGGESWGWMNTHLKSHKNKSNIASGSPLTSNSYYNSESSGIKFTFVFYINSGFAKQMKISSLMQSRKFIR